MSVADSVPRPQYTAYDNGRNSMSWSINVVNRITGDRQINDCFVDMNKGIVEQLEGRAGEIDVNQ